MQAEETEEDRLRRVRRALRLERLTVAWNVIGGAIAVAAMGAAASIAGDLTDASKAALRRRCLIRKWITLVLVAATLMLPSIAFGADEKEGDVDVEPTFILGVGGAAELELGEGSMHPGLNVFLEWEAIDEWLEFELGVSVLAAGGGVEVPVDLLIKKPFRLSRGVVFMIGAGPKVVRAQSPEDKSTRFGGEVALDFMFWPSSAAGFWIEPTYEFTFRNGTSHGLGSTAGVMVSW